MLLTEIVETIPVIADLAGYTPADRRLRIRVSEHCRGPRMIAALLDQARQRGPDAAGWAWCAIEAAESPADRALGWALLGNAERRAGRLAAALSAFEQVDIAPVDLAARPAMLAEVLDLAASWHAHLRDWRRAAAYRTRALELTPANSPRRLHYRLGRAMVRGQSGDPRGAIRELHGIARDLRDGPDDPWARLVWHHNMASFLVLLGEHDLARRTLYQARNLYAHVGGPDAAARAEWIQARIALDLGHYHDAEARLAAVADSLDLVDPIDLGLLELERSQALLGMGRWAEAADRASRCRRLFQKIGVPMEAAAAAITAAEAVATGRTQALCAVIAARRRLGA